MIEADKILYGKRIGNVVHSDLVAIAISESRTRYRYQLRGPSCTRRRGDGTNRSHTVDIDRRGTDHTLDGIDQKRGLAAYLTFSSFAPACIETDSKLHCVISTIGTFWDSSPMIVLKSDNTGI